jgi:hypothetical protein
LQSEFTESVGDIDCRRCSHQCGVWPGAGGGKARPLAEDYSRFESDALHHLTHRTLREITSMSKHTPGPWKAIAAGPREVRLKRDHWEIGSETTRRGVAYAFGGDDANAKLIAAAPELLEACKTLTEWFRREHEGFPNAGQVRTTPAGEAAWRKWWEENLRLCDLAKTQASAAIDKATA